MKKSIGVFDSGLGGLGILKSFKDNLPSYNYLYLGDNARVPYGSRSPELIYEFTVQAVDFLFKNGCEIVILACNTASARSLRRIQQEYLPEKYPEKRVLGIIIPTAEHISEKLKSRRVGVIGTKNTVASKSFTKEIFKKNPSIKVFEKDCPLLVPLIEADENNREAEDLILKNYLNFLTDKKIDTLILGCTHYFFWKERIKKIVGERISIVSQEKIIPDKLEKYLCKHQKIKEKVGREGSIDFYLTDFDLNFKKQAESFFQKKLIFKKIKL
jgi:glutamate racemase